MKNLGDFPTAPEPEFLSGPEFTTTLNLGFVVFWSPEQPSHIGAFIPLLGDVTGRPHILGRGAALATDAYPRLQAQIQRPGSNAPLGPFESPALSRAQLLIAAEQPGVLRVTNTGRCQLVVNGTPTQSADVNPGDLIEVGRQLVLLCAVRPLRFKGTAEQHAFGEPDQYGLVGESAPIWYLRQAIESVGTRHGHVLILGASGTGKELIARAVHARGGAQGAFVARNAGTLPESLLDAELFGSAKGYPNPGMPDRRGLVGAANEGTLFLDEVAELPIAAQTHLLRVLDAGEYQRLGETTTRRSNFRLVAATNQPESALRADVHARFTFRICAPDLAQRREDTPLLARALLKKMASEDATIKARLFTEAGEPRLAPSFLRGLAAHPFSNNVRELRNVLWQAAVADDGPALEWRYPSVAHHPQPAANPSVAVQASRLQEALAANNGSVEKTWRALGLANRFALMRLIKKHGVLIQKDPRKT